MRTPLAGAYDGAIIPSTMTTRLPALGGAGLLAAFPKAYAIMLSASYLPGLLMLIALATAPPSSQGFVLVGTLIMLPAVLGYTWWSYSVFREKVAADAGYNYISTGR